MIILFLNIINIFEAVINLKILVIEKGGKHFDNNKGLNEGENNISQIDTRMLEYLRDREELESLASEYFIKESKCDQKYLDKKWNTIFYYIPPGNKRGGEPYSVPVRFWY